MMTRIWGFDPGLTVGVAVIDCSNPSGVEIVHSTHYWYEVAVLWFGIVQEGVIESYPYEQHLVVENYVGRGPVSKEGRITTQLAGHFYHTGRVLAAQMLFTGVELANPDARLSMYGLATKMIKEATGKEPQRDQLSAMAHALAYAERSGINVQR